MSDVDGFLLVIATIFIVGIIGELVFEKTGVPDVVWLIGVGIFIGPVANWVPRSELVEIAPYFGALTLVIVLFDGGSELRLHDLGRAAPRATLLAVLSFVLSVALVAVLSMAAAAIGWLEHWGWLQAITLGAIIGGSSSVVIMPALRKAGLGATVSNLVNLESALTDVLCVVVTGAAIEIHVSRSTDASIAGLALAKSFGIGILIGSVTGILALLVLRRLARSAYAYPLMLGALLVLYVVINELGGSAALGILAAAVIVGNAPILSKTVGLAETAFLGRGVRNVHDQITFIVKSFFFTFIGAMLAPPWSLLILGVLLGLALLIARLPAVLVATSAMSLDRVERGLVAVSMPRGMAAGVLAMMPAAASPPMPGTEELPVLVFSCVLTTIVVFAVGFTLLKRRLDGLGAEENRVQLPGSGENSLAEAAAERAEAQITGAEETLLAPIIRSADNAGSPADITRFAGLSADETVVDDGLPPESE